MTNTEAWDKWLDAEKDWAASVKHGDTVHTPESLYLAKNGEPVKACAYTNALDDRRHS